MQLMLTKPHYYYCALFWLFPPPESQFMQQMLILSVTLHHVRPRRHKTSRQRPIKHCQCVNLNISCLDTFNFLVIKSLLSDHCIFPHGNGHLVLPPRRPPPPLDPRGRHLHRRGRALPLDEGDQTIWALVLVLHYFYSRRLVRCLEFL